MAKKDFKGGFDSLLRGVNKTPDQEETTQQRPEEVAPAPSKPAGKYVRATFIVDAGLLDKLKALAYWSRTQQKDIINEAIGNYLAEYEKMNGKIKLL